MSKDSPSATKPLTMKPFLVLVFHDEKLLTYATGAPDEKSALLAASQQLVNEDKEDAVALGVFSKSDISSMGEMVLKVEEQIKQIMKG